MKDRARRGACAICHRTQVKGTSASVRRCDKELEQAEGRRCRQLNLVSRAGGDDEHDEGGINNPPPSFSLSSIPANPPPRRLAIDVSEVIDAETPEQASCQACHAPLPDSTNRHIAREFEARLPLFWEASAKIPEYCIVAPRAVSSKFRHLVLARFRKADEQVATPLGRNGDR